MTASLAMPTRPSSSSNAMSWARDSSLSAMLENSAFDHPTPTSFSHLSALLSTSAGSFTSDLGGSLPRLEQNYCQGYQCCGLDLNDLHGLLEHFEEHHVLGTSPAGTIMAPPSAFDTKNRKMSNASKKNLQYSELKKRGAQDLAQAQQSKLVAEAAAKKAAIDQSAPFSMEDDLDMEMETEDSAGTAAAQTAGFSVASPTTQLQSQAAASRQFSSALRQGLDPLSLSTNLNKSLRRSASPTASISSDDFSAPSTPVTETEWEGDWDPSGSSASLNMFAPLGTVTPSMLFPPQFAAQQSQQPTLNINDGLQSLDFDTEDEADDIEVPDYRVTRRGRHSPTATNAIPDFSKNQATIVMGNDPSMTTLAEGTGQAFIAPPPTLPSGRTWVAPAAKPFKCPVPGCDKAYKQQNGLKYHRLHGHCNNRAREGSMTEGDDGRETLEEKPYSCYVGAGCGKRYKNMNGLRYHYQHSGPHGQIGLEMLSMGTHPPPYPTVSKSRGGSRTTSRAASPAPHSNFGYDSTYSPRAVTSH